MLFFFTLSLKKTIVVVGGSTPPPPPVPVKGSVPNFLIFDAYSPLKREQSSSKGSEEIIFFDMEILKYRGIHEKGTHIYLCSQG